MSQQKDKYELLSSAYLELEKSCGFRDEINSRLVGVVDSYSASLDAVISSCKERDVYVSSVIESNLKQIASNIDFLVVSVRDLSGVVESAGGVSIYSMVVPALVGAFSAYLFSHIQWRNERKFNAYRELAKATLQLVDEMESLAISYWSRGYDDDLDRREGAHMKYVHKAVLGYCSQIENLLPKNHLGNTAVLKEFLSKYFDDYLGNDFEHVGRESSPVLVFQCRNECLKAKMALSAIAFSG